MDGLNFMTCWEDQYWIIVARWCFLVKIKAGAVNSINEPSLQNTIITVPGWFIFMNHTIYEMLLLHIIYLNVLLCNISYLCKYQGYGGKHIFNLSLVKGETFHKVWKYMYSLRSLMPAASFQQFCKHDVGAILVSLFVSKYSWRILVQRWHKVIIKFAV